MNKILQLALIISIFTGCQRSNHLSVSIVEIACTKQYNYYESDICFEFSIKNNSDSIIYFPTDVDSTLISPDGVFLGEIGEGNIDVVDLSLVSVEPNVSVSFYFVIINPEYPDKANELGLRFHYYRDSNFDKRQDFSIRIQLNEEDIYEGFTTIESL